MIPCPNCGATMLSRQLPAQASPAPVEIDACGGCSLFWFDRGESGRLAPEAVIDLFRYIASTDGASAGRGPIRADLACPRCAGALAFTHDIQRTTRFTYWRCAAEHGRLITFAAWMREKNFIRTPAPAELVELRRTVRQISCAQCGGPIDIATESVCAHCGSAIALIDPEGVAKALREFTADSRPAADPEAMRQVLATARADAILAAERARIDFDREQRHGLFGVSCDLTGAGIVALAEWLGRSV